MARRDIQQTIRLDELKAGELKDFLKDVPAEATLSLVHTPRDRPFDSEQNSLTAAWSESGEKS